MLYYERKFRENGRCLIIGVDEAGRGPLAGPVIAAAVALKTFRFKNRIDDSKKLTALARERAYLEITGKSIYAIGIANEDVIDRINILEATRLAMKNAIHSLVYKLKAEGIKNIHVLVDGNMVLDIDLPYTSIVAGDGKSKSIASASILAKVTRDRIMNIYDRIYPQYGFFKHKGYPTKEHVAVLKRLGPSLIHRKSFSYV